MTNPREDLKRGLGSLKGSIGLIGFHKGLKRFRVLRFRVVGFRVFRVFRVFRMFRVFRVF